MVCFDEVLVILNNIFFVVFLHLIIPIQIQTKMELGDNKTTFHFFRSSFFDARTNVTLSGKTNTKSIAQAHTFEVFKVQKRKKKMQIS